MRRIVSRVLLAALAIVAIIAAVHLGDGRGDAVVWMRDFDVERLRHDRFELDRPVRLAVSSTGSFEERSDVLAALGWITDDAGNVVWRLDPARPARGTIASVSDTLELPAGRYDAYFASYGTGAVAPPQGTGVRARIRQALSGGRAWRGDAGRWSLRVEPARRDDRDAVRRIDDGENRAVEGALWASGPIENDERVEELLRVDVTTDVSLRAVLEATRAAVHDSAAVIRLGGAGPDTVWAFRYAGSEPAGGVPRNRIARATVRLEPGLYRVVVQTDKRHGHHGWRFNPPTSPWMWGLTLLDASVEDAVAVLSPSDKLALPVLASMTCVGEDEEREDTFSLDAPVSALVVSAGEIINETAYDWGALDRVRPEGGTERLWELSDRNAVAAGGAEKNQMALGVLTLDPGTYRLRYESDGSHHCGSFNTSEPDDPTFWGITLYALDGGFDLATVRRDRAAPPPGPEPEAAERGAPLAAIERVQPDAEEAVGFRAPPGGRVLIHADGRWEDGEAIDYGWIEDRDGETVWSMRDDVHRGKPTVDAFTTLDAGERYTLRYRSGERALSGVTGTRGPHRSIRVNAAGAASEDRGTAEEAVQRGDADDGADGDGATGDA